jgi:hypothetical protein
LGLWERLEKWNPFFLELLKFRATAMSASPTRRRRRRKGADTEDDGGGGGSLRDRMNKGGDDESASPTRRRGRRNRRGQGAGGEEAAGDDAAEDGSDGAGAAAPGRRGRRRRNRRGGGNQDGGDGDDAGAAEDAAEDGSDGSDGAGAAAPGRRGRRRRNRRGGAGRGERGEEDEEGEEGGGGDEDGEEGDDAEENAGARRGGRQKSKNAGGADAGRAQKKMSLSRSVSLRSGKRGAWTSMVDKFGGLCNAVQRKLGGGFRQIGSHVDTSKFVPPRTDFKGRQWLVLNVDRTDPLEEDPYMSHPAVQVHIVDANTGEYLRKSKAARAGVSFNEKQTKMKQGANGPERECQQPCEHIPAAMTGMCDLGSSAQFGAEPRWDEDVRVGGGGHPWVGREGGGAIREECVEEKAHRRERPEKDVDVRAQREKDPSNVALPACRGHCNCVSFLLVGS